MIKKIIISTAIFSVFIFSFSSFIDAEDENKTELISLDIKGMDIRDVLKILSQKSGLNIVADKDVRGNVTLYLKDVDVMDTLDIVASTNGLAYEQKGLVIRVMTDKKYEELHGMPFRDRTKTEIISLNYCNPSTIATAIEQMKTNLGKIIPDDRSNTIVLIDVPSNIARMKDAIREMDKAMVSEVFSLDYAKAEEIKSKLEEMVTEGGGSVKFDERTNKVVITDTPKRMEDIKKIIEVFDEKTREVLIDAHIIQVTLSDKYSYGIDWSDVAKFADVRLTGDTNLSTGLTGVTPTTLTIATTGSHYTTVISLLKTYGKTDVLSKPRITVVDKEEAKILVGSKEVYVNSEVTTTSGGTYHTTDHVQFVDVGVALTVTPIINKAGFVTMRIKPEVSSTDATKTVELRNPDGSTRTIVPYVSTSEAETTIMVKDNTTIIIGGLMKDTLVDHKEKVPFIGDIPLVGKLFSTTGKTKEKVELVIFLTPHIIEGDRTTEEAKSYVDEWKEKVEETSLEKEKEPEVDMKKVLREKEEMEKKIAMLEEKDRKRKASLLEKLKKDKVRVVKKDSESKVKETAKDRREQRLKEREKKKLARLKEREEKKKETEERRLATLREKQGKEKISGEKTELEPEKEKREWRRLFGSEDRAVEKVEGPQPTTRIVKDKDYKEYYTMISQEINDIANREYKEDFRGEVTVQFTLDNKGFLVRGPVVLNKPDLRLVRAAVRTVKQASPFRPFPRGMRNQKEEFTVMVRFE